MDARRELVTGWGRARATAANVVVPRTPDEAASEWERLLKARQPVVARGLGRAYGDAAECAGGTLVDMTSCDRIVGFDETSGAVHAEAGLSIDALLRRSVPKGWFVPVTPGTRFVTVGGALAADIHGKNHHRDGSIAPAVESFDLISPTGRRVVTPEADPDAFWATAGGMGLTGLVTHVSLKLIPIETSLMLVDTDRAGDLDECMALMTERDDDYRYSVAWIDCLARGRHLGRGVLTRGDHARRADFDRPSSARRMRERRSAEPLRYGPRQLARVPLTPPLSPLNQATVAAFNEFWWRRAPRRRTGELQEIARFFHPLDGLSEWNRLYGPSGFTQYQCLVPFGAEAVIRRIVEALSERRAASFLAVLKRFGPSNPGYLSFPAPGWTLALDLPLGLSGLVELLDGFDEQVASVGGRVYLAKDARVRPEAFRAMYPRLGEWQSARERLDPDGVLSSNLARRLGLVEAPAPKGDKGDTSA